MSTDERCATLKQLSQTIIMLDELSTKLIDVMENQIQAVVASDTDKIKKLAEKHIDLKGAFRKHEVLFIEELQKQLASVSGSGQDLKLDMLKKVFPDSVSIIDQWKEGIEENAVTLKNKHRKLIELLEFALDRNTEMMRSIYSIYNRQNTHYSSNGGTNDISSGMAVNQEV